MGESARHPRAAARRLASFALLIAVASPARAQDPAPATLSRVPDRVPAATHSALRAGLYPDTTAARARLRVLRALLTVAGTNILINRLDANVFHVKDAAGACWACVGPADWSRNIRYGWDWDVDAFRTNVFLHPHHGAMYFNAGRSAGLDFWESAPLAFLGSLMWEYFGETERPSLNDLYNTGFGGIALGEVYHRLGMLVRDDRRTGAPRVLRELAALPLDPIGSLNRWLGGGFSRVGPNPPDRNPADLGLVIQTGGRIAEDSGLGRTSTSPSVQVDLAYGDPFRKPFAQPFDVFRVRFQASPNGEGVSVLRVWGRLWARELGDGTGAARPILTLDQRLEYLHTAAYKYAAQSVGLGLVAALGLDPGLDLRAEAFAEGVLMGAVDAPRAGIAGSTRTYDFGPGAGAHASLSVVAEGTTVFSARVDWGYLHSVSGSPADHYLRSAAIEMVAPVFRGVGVGAYAGWFDRRSDYARKPGETASHPEYRLFLAWQPNRTRPLLGGP